MYSMNLSSKLDALNSSSINQRVDMKTKVSIPLLNLTNALSTADRTEITNPHNPHDFQFFKNIGNNNINLFYKRPSDHKGIGKGKDSSLAQLKK